ALDPDVGEHCAHGRHLGSTAKVDLQLVVVDDFRHLTDKPAAGHYRIAAAHSGKHFRSLLHLLALRPDDQEVHDHEDQNEGQNADKDVRCAACLGICRCHKHENSPEI